jgi:thymidylate synthase
MNNLDKQYTDLLQDILDNGVQKGDRTGTGTISVFSRQIHHKMSDGFPLLTTKKMPFKTIVTELLWFLRGDTNIKYLVDNNCHIWDGDAYKRYLNTYKGNFELDKEEFINAIKTSPDFAKQWGELGPIYGKQWRSWKSNKKDTSIESGNYMGFKQIDQIANLINDLKTNPDSRRLMVNAWNVGELEDMVLPPCHNLFQMYSVEKEGKRHLSIMVNIRSNDVPLGLPFNIASYGLLLEIIAKSTNMTPDELIINIGDAHIYLNQIEGIKEQLTREPYPLPTLKINSGNENWYLLEIDEIINSFDPDLTFKVENYQSHPSIKLPLSN